MYICAALDFAAVIIKPCSTALLVQRMLNALPLCLLEGRAEDVMIFVSWLRSFRGIPCGKRCFVGGLIGIAGVKVSN